jgi:cell division protein FtsI (penicillin-binding protein 3)
VADSSLYQYAGYTPDVKNVFTTLNVNHVDSSYKNSWSWIYNNNYRPVVKATPVSKNAMPDLKNMTLKDALYLLENMDLKVLTKGRGKVVAQDVLPGTVINKNQTITLLLN